MTAHPKVHPTARSPLQPGDRPRRFQTLAVIAMTFAVGILLASDRAARADEPVVVKLNLHAARIDPAAPYPRLLPADPDLKPGNAAVVLLRMPWEQRLWMQEWLPKLAELAQLPPGDPRVAEFHFDRFAGQMHRAAFIRDADWVYPLEDEPLDSILLPDLAGLRDFIGRGMPIWINQRIAAGDLVAAREGVLTMLACSRHMARTPFFIPHIVAAATTGAALDRVECLIAQPECPNLYTSLALLPDTIGDCQPAIQMEARMIERSLPGLRGGFPASGDVEGWKAVMDDYLRQFDDQPGEDGTAIDPDERRRIRAAQARAGVARGVFAAPESPVSDDELAVRYILAKHAEAHRHVEAAWQLPPPDAIGALVAMESEANAESQGETRPWASFLRVYLATKGFGRRARMLEVVEALRDAAARNGGRFPPSLADVPARVPLDPFTGKPFIYEPSADGRSARLATPPIPGVDEPRYSRIYELTLATE
jgi:hypothetical protein